MRRGLAALALIACGGPVRKPAPALPATIAAACAGPEQTETLARCVGALVDLTAQLSRPRYDDPALLGYVQRVADRVATAAGSAPVKIRVLDDPGLVGEGSVGGFIYVSRGALAVLDDEAELAGLLGHEIGHLVAGHAIDGIKSRGGSVEIQVEEERLADELAVVFAGRAGYRPGAVATMLARLIVDGDRDRAPTADHPHPIRAARVARTALLAESMTGAGELGRDRYLEAIDGLVVGRDPRSGFVAGDRFVHARARLAVRWPDGWVVEAADLGAVARRGKTRVGVAVIATELARLVVDDESRVVAGDRGLSMLITGDAAGAARAYRPAARSIAAVQPARIAVIRAPRAAPTRALIGELCQSPGLALAIERDLDGDRPAGEPIKCVTAGARAW